MAARARRLVILGVLFGIVSVLVACGNAGVDTGQAGVAPSPTPSPVPAKVGQTITVGGVSCTLLAVQKLPNSTLEVAPDGKSWLAVHVRLKNDGTSTYTSSSLYFKVVEGDGTVDGSGPPATDNYTGYDGLYVDTIAPGTSLTGALFFVVTVPDPRAVLIWTAGDEISDSTQHAWRLGL